MIDKLVEEVDKLHILPIGAGHGPEAIISTAVKRRKISRFVPLDSDAQVLGQFEKYDSAYGDEIVAATLRQRLAQKDELGHFDFIYSTGLYDHLHLLTAQRLTPSMFQILRPRRHHWPGTFSRESKTSDPWIGS